MARKTKTAFGRYLEEHSLDSASLVVLGALEKLAGAYGREVYFSVNRISFEVEVSNTPKVTY